jgi:glutathione S-transferase
MIKFYFHPSPNPLKIALYLEETGEPYELIAVDTRKGEQHADSFKAINPNAKTPAMMDGDANARPAAQRAETLKTKFTFKTEVDEDARKMLFPSNEQLKNV